MLNPEHAIVMRRHGGSFSPIALTVSENFRGIPAGNFFPAVPLAPTEELGPKVIACYQPLPPPRGNTSDPVRT